MREIKFRAWDVERKKMAYGVEREYDTVAGVIFEDGEEPGGYAFGAYLDEKLCYGKEDKRYIVEQYTGLKDKNGKEIYEGDIYNGEYRNQVVEWEQESKIICEGHGSFFRHYVAGYDLDGEEIEIIGNIHQNPELLG